jgi:hypothetical protein
MARHESAGAPIQAWHAGPMPDEPNAAGWYAVRCIFRSGWPPPESAGRAYEERITLWRATSFNDAIERAEVEAHEYASAISDRPDRYLELAQAYLLDDEPGDGAEIFSLIRLSDLKPKAYLKRHFATGTERQHDGGM